MQSPEWAIFISRLNIKHVTSITGSYTVERFSRAPTHIPGARMASKKLPKQEWTSELLQVLRKDNSSHHRTIGTTPNQAARQPEMTKLNVEPNSQFTGTYPEIENGDKVRFRFIRNNKRKDTEPVHSNKVISVLGTSTDGPGNKQTLYIVPSAGKRLYQRHEQLNEQAFVLTI